MAYGFNLGTSGNWNTDNNFDSSNIDWKGATTALPGGSWESKSSDWGNWDGPKLDSDSGWGKAARFAGDIWKTMQQKKSYRDELESSNRPYGGQTSGGASGQILPNLGVVYPPTFSPIVISGQQPSGSSGTSGIWLYSWRPRWISTSTWNWRANRQRPWWLRRKKFIWLSLLHLK